MFQATEPALSALPLGSLTVVVFDTETTGLDTTSDRIIEIGAVRVSASRIGATDRFERLIDPGVPIPTSATAIHGIGDKDIEGAAGFAEVMPDFAAYVSRDVVLGYAIGFDLAILKCEHERAGLIWKQPRGLDIAHLVQLISPPLPAPSLDTIAAWLGIDIQNRHRGLGDALLTAEVYLALLPMLRKKGVGTLAEAERACLALTSRIDDEARAGWQGAARPKTADGISRSGGRARVDSFPYRHRLRDVMSSPPLIMTGDVKVGQALRRMMKDRVSSVFLEPANDHPGLAILTERDILRAIDRMGADALDQPAHSFASHSLISMAQTDLVYRAISRMAEAGTRHLGVRDDDGEIVGALSARDLLRQRAGDMITLGDHIDKATSSAELGHIWSGLAAVANALVDDDVDALDIAGIISSELRALTRRASELAELAMMENGEGPPPVPYAMLVLGSGGRGESLLAMDQDNAIVFESGAPGGDADQWFESLGKRVATILDEAGVAYCKGGVMASKQAWRMDVEHWRKTVATWVSASKPENMLSADIFFDGRPVCGDLGLGDALMRSASEAARRSLPFLSSLSVQAAAFETPIGWFGRFKLKEGRVDLKMGGLMALFSTARVLALRFGLAERSTRARFLAARAHLERGDEAIADLLEAHRLIVEAILRQQLRDLDQGVPLSNRVKPSSLSNLERRNLRWALERIPLTANLLGVGLYG